VSGVGVGERPAGFALFFKVVIPGMSECGVTVARLAGRWTRIKVLDGQFDAWSMDVLIKSTLKVFSRVWDAMNGRVMRYDSPSKLTPPDTPSAVRSASPTNDAPTMHQRNSLILRWQRLPPTRHPTPVG
jgi:hypothetical protein